MEQLKTADKEQTDNVGLRKTALFVVLTSSFVMSFMGSALNLSVPSIGRDFQVSAEKVGWIITCYMLCVAALSVPFGRLADVTCRQRIFVTGLGIFTAGCIASVFSPNMTVLICLRTLQGVGGAMVLSTNTPILLSTFPGAMRGKALGYSVGAVYVGLSLGPVIGGLLNQSVGWKGIFVFAGVIALASLVTAAAKLPAVPSEGKGRSADAPGGVLFALFIVLFMYGLSEIGDGWHGPAAAAAGVIFGAAFAVRELKCDDPALNISLFRNNKAYTLSNITAMMNYAATFALGYLTSIYLQVVAGYSSRTAGLILIIQPAIMAVLTLKTGRMSDYRSPFKMASLGMAFCAAGIIIFLFVGAESSLLPVAAGLAVTGVGFAFFSSPNTNAVLSCVKKADYGVATSVLNTMRTVGQTSSMVIVTIIVTAVMPGIEITQADPEMLVRIMHIAFVVFAVICTAGIFMSLAKNKGNAGTEDIDTKEKKIGDQTKVS